MVENPMSTNDMLVHYREFVYKKRLIGLLSEVVYTSAD